MAMLRSSSLYRVAEFAVLTIVLGIALHAQNGYTFTTIDFPGGTATQARGLSQKGDIVGIYTDPATGLWRGFLLSAGNYSTIDFPGASQTYPRGINKKGDVVGFFVDSSGNFHGFLLNSGGYQQLDVPGSLGTAVRAITDNRLIVGDTSFDNVTNECFVLKNGKYSTFSFPGQTLNTCVGVSSRGDVVGYYTNGDDFGFIRRLGKFTPLSALGDPLGMNDLDQVAGVYASNGYVADIGTVTAVVPPGASSSSARGISVKGVIVGSYVASGVTHGFVATPTH
jgi:uncharacterized membrane protein